MKRRTNSNKTGIAEIEIPDTDADYLFSALNFPLIDCVFWWGKEDFCAELRELAEEIQTQFLIRQKAGQPIDKTLARDFVDRYERHRRIFQEVQLEMFLLRNYRAKTVLSSKVDHEKSKQNRALYALFELIQKRRMDYLKRCPICERWYLATRSDQDVCTKACRQKRYTGNPEYNKRRRENYALKKRLGKKTRKTNGAQKTR
jgi:hypothetical protein